MIPFSLIFWGILFATLVPAYLALYLLPYLRGVPLRYLAAAGFGLTMWFFFDIMGDAASLDENYGFYPSFLFGGVSHVLLILTFVAGVATLAVLDHLAVGTAAEKGGWGAAKGSLFLIPAAVAFVMGIHGLGEGWDASSAVAAAPITTSSPIGALIQAFGNLPAVVSYPIHKFLEASIVGIVYVAYVVRGGAGAARKYWHVPVLGLLFGGPSVIGSALGYFYSFDTTFFYAFGVTSALYALMRLVGPMASESEFAGHGLTRFGWRIFVAVGAGFFLLYTAALLH